MPRRIKQPSPDTFLAKHPTLELNLYAELAPVPLYAKIRLIGKGVHASRQSFWLGWLITPCRFARGGDSYVVPEEIKAWAARIITDAYPSVAEAAGLTDDEIAALERAQEAKRAMYE